MLMRRPVRVGRPTLLGTAARTAVVAGTATAVSGGMMRHQQQKAMEQQEAAAYEQQQYQQMQAAAQQAPAPAPAAGQDIVGELQKLADMKAQGLLSDEEFENLKGRLLGS